MKITHSMLNTILIEHPGVTFAIDPGRKRWFSSLERLFPESEWPTVTHLVVADGDPDYHEQSSRAVKTSDAHLVSDKRLARTVDAGVLVVTHREWWMTWPPIMDIPGTFCWTRSESSCGSGAADWIEVSLSRWEGFSGIPSPAVRQSSSLVQDSYGYSNTFLRC